MKEILFELENSAKSDRIWKGNPDTVTFLQFMVYLNRIFLESSTFLIKNPTPLTRRLPVSFSISTTI
mgnify:CR=1 FL=1